MARPSLVTRAQILDAARELAWERGTGAVAVKEVALRLGRPSGSFYHRYPGRDHLLAELWLEAVEHFQDGYLVALEGDDAVSAARAAARHVLVWSREEVERAHVLLWFRLTDLLAGELPADTADRASRTGQRLQTSLHELAERLAVSPRRLRLAVVDVPYAVVRRDLARGGNSLEDEKLVDQVVLALIADLRAGSGGRI